MYSTYFADGTHGALGRAVSAEVRSAMAARRMGLRPFAAACGWSSHNYLAKRLRDEAPLTLDDVDRICSFLRVQPADFIERAIANHMPLIMEEIQSRSGGTFHHAVAADDHIGKIEEQESDDHP